jgi:hypothetical protein
MKTPVLKTAGLALLATGLLCGSAASGTQSYFNYYGRLVAPALIPYGEAQPVPANGCVWDNLVYSNGAVIARGVPLITYFRCERGTWMVTSAGDAIFGPRVPERPGTVQPVPP